MTTTNAIAILERIQLHAPDDLPVPDWAKHQPLAPAAFAALADLTGWLEDATTVQDLIDAIEHGVTLVKLEIIGEPEWTSETVRLRMEAR